MAWVDLDYYKEEYLMGRKPSILDSDFAFYEKQAEQEINWKHVTVDAPQDCLKQCVCEVAELLCGGGSKNDIPKIRSRHLANTEYHDNFVYRGVSIT